MGFFVKEILAPLRHRPVGAVLRGAHFAPLYDLKKATSDAKEGWPATRSTPKGAKCGGGGSRTPVRGFAFIDIYNV